MAQTSHRQSISAQVSTSKVGSLLSTQRSLALRRLLAWGLEASLLISSGVLPWAIGEVVRQHDQATGVALNPISSLVQGAMARPLGWPRQRRVTVVPPLTNVLWLSALILPIALASSQLHGLAKTGKTWPKAWLGLQVVALEAPVPGYRAVIIRELVGRWGLPLAIAYVLWLGSGAFPSLPLLGALTLASCLGEGLTSQSNRSRRAWHDYLAGTRVMRLQGGQVPTKHRPETPAPGPGDLYSALPLAQQQILTVTQETGGLTAIIFAPSDQTVTFSPRSGWRRYLSLPILGGVAGVIALIGLAWLWLEQRSSPELTTVGSQHDALFLALVENLSLNATSFSDQQTAALALASSQDPRAITLLVDLLAQTGDPALLDTIQQALMTLGPPAIPALQRLNLTLANEVISLPPEQRLIPQLRQRTVKRTLAQILVLHSGRFNQVDLSGTNLSQVIEGPDEFTLLLENQHLAGIIWKNALLSGARLRKATFFDPGFDGRPDTFDDWITDFSGSDLTEASLVATQLRHAIFRNASLLRTNLSNAQAEYADFSGANAGSAWFIEADLSSARFDQTSLVGADLTNAQLSQASFVEARLKQAYLVGATLTNAMLTRADLSDADLSEASLVGARLEQANLGGSRLRAADFSRANLTEANLQNADLQGIILSQANLTGANFSGARFFTLEQRQPDGFIATTTDPEPTNALGGVDFSKALNLEPDQLQYICRQGGLHPACTGEF